MRDLYRCLVWLHPPVFRQRFAGEVLWIFDEAAGTWGAVSLLADAGISLLRQWLMQSELCKGAVAFMCGIL